MNCWEKNYEESQSMMEGTRREVNWAARETAEGLDRALYRRCLDLADAAGGDSNFAIQPASLLYALVTERGRQLAIVAPSS